MKEPVYILFKIRINIKNVKKMNVYKKKYLTADCCD